MLAAKGGHVKTVEALIQAGADVDTTNGVSVLINNYHSVTQLTDNRKERHPLCWPLQLVVSRLLKF